MARSSTTTRPDGSGAGIRRVRESEAEARKRVEETRIECEERLAEARRRARSIETRARRRIERVQSIARTQLARLIRKDLAGARKARSTPNTPTRAARRRAARRLAGQLIGLESDRDDAS